MKIIEYSTRVMIMKMLNHHVCFGGENVSVLTKTGAGLILNNCEYAWSG